MITLSATVRNGGDRQSTATEVHFFLGTTSVGTAAVGALAAGASATVTANIGARDAGSYSANAKVDEDNDVIESNETNNAFTNPIGARGHRRADVRPGRLAGQLDADRPTERCHGDVLGGRPQPGHARLGGRRARHHAHRRQRDDRCGGAHADRLGKRRDRPGRGDGPGQPRHVDGRERPLHRPGRPGHRCQRAAGETGQQHQRRTTCSSAGARTCRSTPTRRRTA